MHLMPVDARIEILPDDVVVVTLSGSMTQGTSLRTADAQVQNVLSNGARKLVMDLTQVDYSDSAGLGFLVHTYGLLNSQGGSLRVCGLSPRVRSLLAMTKTDSVLPVDPTREESLQAVRR